MEPGSKYMEVMYMCMRCGNNLAVPKCNFCTQDTIMVVVTDENRDKLPFPTHPEGMLDPKDIDFNNPGKNCQCKAGTCPCGAFVAHKVTEPCNSHEYPQIEKA